MKGNRIAVISANMGSFESTNFIAELAEQSVPFDFFQFDDQNFPPRAGAMTPRLQARLVKMFGWEVIPKHDIYIWIDGSCALKDYNSVAWLASQVDDVNIHMAVLKHPHRNSIQEEADYLQHRLNIGCPYITPRYKGELIAQQMEYIKKDPQFVDDKLFASTVMVYKHDQRVFDMMKEWWFHTTRFHVIDQLSLPYVIMKSRCNVRVIPDNYLKTPYITYVRNK